MQFLGFQQNRKLDFCGFVFILSGAERIILHLFIVSPAHFRLCGVRSAAGVSYTVLEFSPFFTADGCVRWSGSAAHSQRRGRGRRKCGRKCAPLAPHWPIHSQHNRQFNRHKNWLLIKKIFIKLVVWSFMKKKLWQEASLKFTRKLVFSIQNEKIFCK